jgi:hypothetical protein
LFQDDAAHYLNHSSNILMEVKCAGSEEAGMMKSVGSVFENNVVADSVLGHVYMLTPYLEPAANMIFTNNIFANLTTTSNAGPPPPPPPAGQPPPPPAPAQTLDTTTNGYTAGTLATSGSLKPFAAYHFEKGNPPDFPELKLSDKVMLLFDRNTYFGVANHNLSGINGECHRSSSWFAPSNCTIHLARIALVWFGGRAERAAAPLACMRGLLPPWLPMVHWHLLLTATCVMFRFAIAPLAWV